MPNTKNPENSKATKTTKTSSTKKVSKTEQNTATASTTTSTVKDVKDVSSAKPVISTENSQTDDKKKSMRKAGKTVLVKSVTGNSIDSSVFESLTGLVSHSETKTSISYFLTFDNITNSLNAFNTLRANSEYKVKFSYYRVFFTVNGLTDKSEYNQVKQDIVNYVTEKSKASVLYCKLYRKEDTLLGCGDFTIDTIDGMNALLSKESELKNFTIGELTGTFYRYNGKKEKSEQNEANS